MTVAHKDVKVLVRRVRYLESLTHINSYDEAEIRALHAVLEEVGVSLKDASEGVFNENL